MNIRNMLYKVARILPRRVAVCGCLVMTLGLTSGLLMAISPPPLPAGGWQSTEPNPVSDAQPE